MERKLHGPLHIELRGLQLVLRLHDIGPVQQQAGRNTCLQYGNCRWQQALRGIFLVYIARNGVQLVLRLHSLLQ